MNPRKETRPYLLPLVADGWSGIARKRSHFVFVMDQRTDRRTDTACCVYSAKDDNANHFIGR